MYFLASLQIHLSESHHKKEHNLLLLCVNFIPLYNIITNHCTKIDFSIKGFFSKCNQVNHRITLRENCLYSEFFWSVFSCICTEYWCFSPNAGKCGPENLRIQTLLSNVRTEEVILIGVSVEISSLDFNTVNPLLNRHDSSQRICGISRMAK